ncbi:hypothetical protein S40285_07445 [Stachybotrys chlorohalonatus IBT 40285]|uniref:Cupin type-2 domain-containing protein n=1 Tax=Stachybotrys chlorohalonatus (strain IBT 40285) TaxID=1283841 RepID=A0A084R122_STAC4|nr:hypothetical protein S40285_07445 [Stachybotrys chlorohalonata IBT 40285]
MALEPSSLKVHITTDTESEPKASSFLSVEPTLPQPVGSTTSLSYIYSTPPSFTLANNADLTHYLATASSGPPYHFPSAGSTVITHMEFGPNPEQEDGFWHRTQTVDYIVMLEGELELSLDGGEKKTMKKGDIVIQRAAMHKWKNPSKTESAKFVGVLLGAEGAVEGGVEYGAKHLR